MRMVRGARRRGWLRTSYRAAAAVGVLTAGTAMALVGTMAAQGVAVARRLSSAHPERVHPGATCYGADRPGTPIRFGILGDSLAAGYGATAPEHTLGALLAGLLVGKTGRPVMVANVAEVGAETPVLPAQLARLEQAGAMDVVLIVIGANDVMRLRHPALTLGPLAEVSRELRRTGTALVVATCPDLGMVTSLPRPLRHAAHHASRFIALCQTIVVLRSGGRTVSLGDTLGALFRADPDGMFSPEDRLHPSDSGYRKAAEVILPSVRAAVGAPGPRIPHRVHTHGRRYRLSWWAMRMTRGMRAAAVAVTTAPAADGARPHDAM